MALQIPSGTVDVEAVEHGDSVATADALRTILNALNGLLGRPSETGKWTPYTPIWSSTSGGTGSIGNGILEGRYSIVGDVLFVNIHLTWGSTTSSPHASAGWTFSLPANVEDVLFMAGHMIDNSTSELKVAIGIRDASTDANIMHAYRTGGSDDPLSATVPWTWATSDTLTLAGVAEIIY